MRFAVLAASALLALAVHPADACVRIDDEITPHELDPGQAGDATPPAAPTADFMVSKHEVSGGCLSKTDCDGKYAEIDILIAGTDDATPSERLGYILTIQGGDLPQGSYHRFADGFPYFQPRGEFTIGFDYDDETFDFDVEIRTVDLNGNVSEPTMLHIALDEGGGCSISTQRSDWLVLPVLLFALRRRRRC